VTGGEPLQHPAIDAVLDGALTRWARVEVETSGIAPPPRSHPCLHYNVSPKLPAATPRWRETWRHTTAWLAEPRATFKIVIAGADDLRDFETWQSTHGVPAARIMLMPEGMDAATLRAREAWLEPWCAARGLLLSPRLHIERWGARRGV
jgi:7-carboxy-7-deazaguanine synthase